MWLYRLLKALIRILLIPFIPVSCRGAEHIPQQGKAILVGNHISMLDPIIMFALTRRHLRFMAKAEIFNVFVVGWAARTIGAFPINRGSADLSGIRTALEILKNDGVVMLYPEGTRNPNRGGPMLPLHEGAALLALKSGAPIIPVFVGGRYGLFTGVKVVVGEPVNTEELNARRVDKQTMTACVQRMREAIHALGGIQE